MCVSIDSSCTTNTYAQNGFRPFASDAHFQKASQEPAGTLILGTKKIIGYSFYTRVIGLLNSS